MSVLVAALPLVRRAAVPVEVDRAEARDAARAELARPEYQAHQPSLVERFAGWLREQLLDLLDRAAAASPGGYGGLVVALLLLVLAGVAVRATVGPLGRAAERDGSLFVGAPRSAQDHRRAAEEHAAAGRWAEALRERLRALVRGLEERGLVEPRPGRTADEAAREAGVALPAYADPLRAAATAFDEVWYGGRPGTEAAYRRLADLDEQVRAARPDPAAGVPR